MQMVEVLVLFIIFQFSDRCGLSWLPGMCQFFGRMLLHKLRLRLLPYQISNIISTFTSWYRVTTVELMMMCICRIPSSCSVCTWLSRNTARLPALRASLLARNRMPVRRVVLIHSLTQYCGYFKLSFSLAGWGRSLPAEKHFFVHFELQITQIHDVKDTQILVHHIQ